MTIKTIRFIVLFALFSVVSVSAGTKTKEELAQLAVSADAAVSAEAVRELRAMGRDGLDALVRLNAVEIARYLKTGETTEEWKRLAAALDSVAMQKDAYAARLFWHTDLEAAKREAAAQNKPILSLRLLGNLNEEFSCANSRFFRALLYANAEISEYLRANYVLHWKSVRPAPRVTIDFGDGRRLERTVTGNSIHYILDAKGEIFDALPGLYAPENFFQYLMKSREFFKKTEKLQKWEIQPAALRYRRERYEELAGRRDELIRLARIELKEPAPSSERKTTALMVAPLAVTKMATERTVLFGIADGFARYEPQIRLDQWRQLSKLFAGETRFDEASRRFIRRQNRTTGLTDAQLASLFSNLEQLVALDTTRNEFLFHTKLYEWLNQPGAPAPEVERFNALVYSILFQTPDSDKWLGLYEADVYTALDGGGIVK